MSDDDAARLEAAIAASGLSARKFAEWALVRDERTVRRWLGGDDMPAVVARWLDWWLALPASRRVRLVRLLTMPAPQGAPPTIGPETGA